MCWCGARISGGVPVYLLDTDIEKNQPWDRAIGHRLYITESEQRLRQEIVLGVGGMCVLEALGIQPAGIHINEGHPGLALLEHVRMLVHKGTSFQEAMAKVRETSIFHDAHSAHCGNRRFPLPAVREIFRPALTADSAPTAIPYCNSAFSRPIPGAGFNMTAFALRMTKFTNAVSKKHGEVARQMWSSIWPDKKQEEVPIVAVTNGVHLLTWLDPIWLQPLLDRYSARIGRAIRTARAFGNWSGKYRTSICGGCAGA